MKKIFCVTVALIIILSLVSCTKKSDDNNESRPVVVLPESSIPTIVIETSSNQSSDNSSDSSKAEDPKNIIYVGNKSSKIFHKETCKSVSSMKSENMISFESFEEAVSNNYKPCGNCLKE